MTRLGFWLTDDNVPAAEIVAQTGFDFVVLDAEHGPLGTDSLDRSIAQLRALGLEVFVKLFAPEGIYVQQALDFGAHAVIAPHVMSAEHAEELTQYLSFPPRGRRSIAGGRMFDWGATPGSKFDELDAGARLFPLIEHPEAVRDIEQIAALPGVAGVQLGPGDLSNFSGRGALSLSDADWADYDACIAAVVRHGKQWMFPGWSGMQREWAVGLGVDYLLVGMQYQVLYEGIHALHSDAASLLSKGDL